MKIRTLIGTTCTLLVVGCGGSGGETTTPVSSDSTTLAGLESCVQTDSNQSLLCGTAVAADGVTPLSGAEISISEVSSNPNAAGKVTLRGIASTNQCLTDSQGEFACVVPNSISGITAFKLTADGFVTRTFDVNMQSGQVATAQPQSLDADATVQWAVVPGLFDGVQVLLAQLKGCTLNDSLGNPWNNSDPFPADARGSTDCESKGLRVLESDEVAFFTDGSLDQYDALFVNCDADLSFNDEINTAINNFNANGNHVYFSDLSDGWLDAIFPNQIEFSGNDTYAEEAFSATVVDENLAAVVGNRIDLVFDYSVWTAIDTVSDNSTVYIEADISEISDYDGVKPITVGFKPQGSDACVFFTSYHIEGASTGSDQELAIKYLIQNIGTVCA